MTKIQKTEAEWRTELSPDAYHVLREKGTEAPFSGEYDHTFEPGSYRCAGCGAELGEDVREVDFDGAAGDEHPLPDLRICQSLRDELCHA